MIKPSLVSYILSAFHITKKGTTAAAGGNTLCDINQIVRSLLGGKRNLKRASAYAAGKPTTSANAVETKDMMLLLYMAK